MSTLSTAAAPNPIAAFIDELGGTQTVASKTGHTPGNVRKWRCVRKLPRSVWPEVLEAFPQVTLERLRALEAPQ